MSSRLPSTGQCPASLAHRPVVCLAPRRVPSAHASILAPFGPDPAGDRDPRADCNSVLAWSRTRLPNGRHPAGESLGYGGAALDGQCPTRRQRRRCSDEISPSPMLPLLLISASLVEVEGRGRVPFSHIDGEGRGRQCQLAPPLAGELSMQAAVARGCSVEVEASAGGSHKGNAFHATQQIKETLCGTRRDELLGPRFLEGQEIASSALPAAGIAVENR
jgi:hypothetical protein